MSGLYRDEAHNLGVTSIMLQSSDPVPGSGLRDVVAPDVGGPWIFVSPPRTLCCSATVSVALQICRFLCFLVMQIISVAGFPAWLERSAGALGTAGQVPAGRKYPELLFPQGKLSLSPPPELSLLPLEAYFLISPSSASCSSSLDAIWWQGTFQWLSLECNDS